MGTKGRAERSEEPVVWEEKRHTSNWSKEVEAAENISIIKKKQFTFTGPRRKASQKSPRLHPLQAQGYKSVKLSFEKTILCSLCKKYGLRNWFLGIPFTVLYCVALKVHVVWPKGA